MEINNFIRGVIGAVVLIVVVVAVAIPIISGLDNASGENTGETARYDAGGSHLIAVGADGVTVDGVAVANPSATTYIVIADTLNVSMSTAGALTLTTVSGTAYATTTMASGSSLSLANGTASYTATSGGDATEYGYGKAFVYDVDGRWGAYSGATIHALPGSTVTAWVASSTQMGLADIKGGELVYELPSLPEIQAYCKREVATLWPEVLRFDYPHNYYVDLSDRLLGIKHEMLGASHS